MVDVIQPTGELAAAILEALGVATIVLFVFYGLSVLVKQLVVSRKLDSAILISRQTIGRGILLGLELLVAADIIHTVAVEITFRSAGVLALIVLIRTFLSFTLHVEINGIWPWQQKTNMKSGPETNAAGI